jgi:glyoxylase-like metal-dependent hydrolase (beta-lactamase superfamily II)
VRRFARGAARDTLFVVLQRDVAEGVHRVRDSCANWYLVEEGSRLTLIDAGVADSWSSLVTVVAALGRSLGDIAGLVLTHAHLDHIGFAERARAELGIDVWVHEDDVPLTRHPLQYAHEASPLGYALRNPAALLTLGSLVRHRAFLVSSIREVRRFCEDAGALPLPGAPRVVFTPGHTLGHCALHLPDRDTVIAGDALVTWDPYTGGRGPRLMPRASTADSARALASLDALAATGARVVLPGHGEPWLDGVEEAARRAQAVGIT